MKESIASGDSAGSGPAQQGPAGGAMPGEAGAASDAAQRKALASSPAEARTSVLSQVWKHHMLHACACVDCLALHQSCMSC
jgi:hypothetical protein